MSVQTWLDHIWYRCVSPPWWLKPPSLLYGAVSSVRRSVYARRLRRSVPLSCPVIVVGNLSVGGTGKTPLVCWLVARLIEMGYAPGVVTRGYGGSFKGMRLVRVTDDPRQVGDEPVLLARRTDAPVMVGANRPAAARILMKSGCNVIVSDDGLQHYALARDCEIVVIDGDRRFGNGWLLPAGPLRERPERLKSADAIVVNGGRAVLAGALSMRLESQHAVALIDGSRTPLSAWVGTKIHAIAGIGNPERFFNMLRARGIEVIGHPHADHARLEERDLRFGDSKPIFMTEKDAVKCAAFAGEQHFYVPVTAYLDAHEAGLLLDVVLGKMTNRDVQSQGSIDG